MTGQTDTETFHREVNLNTADTKARNKAGLKSSIFNVCMVELVRLNRRPHTASVALSQLSYSPEIWEAALQAGTPSRSITVQESLTINSLLAFKQVYVSWRGDLARLRICRYRSVPVS